MVEVSDCEQENELVEEVRVGINPTKTEHEQGEQLRQMMDEDMGNCSLRKADNECLHD